MHQVQIIKILIIVFFASLPIVYIFKRINVPTIIGFLLAGIIIGPHGFKLINEIETINLMSQIGVILLMFTIGLELSVSRLVRMKNYIFIAGGLQILLTILLSILIFSLIGVSLKLSIFFGGLISLSSTAIVLELLSDENELHSPHGRISLGILIFQDLAVIPMLIFLPLLSADVRISYFSLILKLASSFILLMAVIYAARYIIPILLYQLARLKIREAFTLGTVLLILATAYLTYSLGLPLALGAFIAGIILTGTNYTHQIFAEIIPMKDFFNSFGFVSIGLLFNLHFLIDNRFLILGLIIGIIVFKILIVSLVVTFIRYPIRIAIMSALSIAQIGEFSFLLAQAGLSQRLINSFYYDAFLSSAVFTILLTPLILKMAPWISLGIREYAKPKLDTQASDTAFDKLRHHVIIVGFGINGKNIARVLKETGIGYVILELNPETVKTYRAKGENILFGDATRMDVLLTTRIKNANVIVFAISDPKATRLAIKLAKELKPSIYCIARTRFTGEVDDMLSAGADEVIPEEFETSLQIFTKVLQKYHIPANVIAKQANIIRSESYQMLRNETATTPVLTHLDRILAEGLTETYFVEETNQNIGKNLRELNLRARTGATVIAFMRDGKTIANPSGKEKLTPHDTLVIYGNHMAVDKATRLLNGEAEK